MYKEIRFFLSLVCIGIKSSITMRGTFIFQVILMIVNNLIFFSMWWILFKKFNTVAGWKIGDMMGLSIIGMGSYGLMQVCFGGVKGMSKMIINGDLDPFMTQPKNILLHVIGSKSHSKGWGSILTAFILLILSPYMTISSILLIILSILSGCLVFTSINVMAHCLAFWFGSTDMVSRKYCEALFLCVQYPVNIYSGLLQFVMFTFIPAGIIGYIPVELLRNFSLEKLLLLLISSAGFFALSFFVFYAGLKKYESGSKFGLRS